MVRGMAVASYADDTATVVIAAGDEDATDVRVGQVQEWLENLGYYQGEHTMVFDANTRYALYSFCQANGLRYTDEGITQEAWDLLQSGGGKPASNDAEAYKDIAYGSAGDDVLMLQTRLKELGYFTGDNVLTPSVFDEGTREAVKLFCENNNISYDGDTGVSASVQYIIYSDGAAAYSEPEVKLSASEKLTAYMKREVSVFGAVLPMSFIWICSVIIVVLILILSVYFFVPDREKAAAKKQTHQNTTPRYWRKQTTGPSGAGLQAREKLSNSGNLLEFQIHYNGNVKNFQCTCKPTITIGRSDVCGITLDPGDVAVSHSHCDLYYRGAVLMLRDHSFNGTYVNDCLIHKSECRLNSGDRLTIGSHVLVIQF